MSGHSVAARRQVGTEALGAIAEQSDQSLLSSEGIAASIFGALALAVVLSWVFGQSQSYVTRKRLIFLVVLLVAFVILGQVYMRRQWLRYRREQSLSEMSIFVATSYDFDSATEATLALVQEVELVSRGYRMHVQCNHTIPDAYANL